MAKRTLDTLSKIDEKTPVIKTAKTDIKSVLTEADIEIIKERIGNMTQEEQTVVASALDSSIMEHELHNRRIEFADTLNNIATQVRRINVKWAK